MLSNYSKQDVEEIIQDFNGHSLTDLLPKKGDTWGAGNHIAPVAGERGHVSTLRFLAEQGVDLSLAACGRSAISAAAAHGQDAAVAFLKDLPGIDMRNADQKEDHLSTSLSLIQLAEANSFPALANKIEGWMEEAKNGTAARKRSLNKNWALLTKII